MKFGKKIKYGEEIVKEFFAWFPYVIDGEWRWFERIKVLGYYTKTFRWDDLKWNDVKFIDDDK